MQTIYKYPLEIAAEQIVKLPTGAKILNVLVVNNQVCLYARVNADSKSFTDRNICIFGTGHEIVNPHHKDYIASVVHGQYVWHIYEQR